MKSNYDVILDCSYPIWAKHWQKTLCLWTGCAEVSFIRFHRTCPGLQQQTFNFTMAVDACHEHSRGPMGSMMCHSLVHLSTCLDQHAHHFCHFRMMHLTCSAQRRSKEWFHGRFWPGSCQHHADDRDSFRTTLLSCIQCCDWPQNRRAMLCPQLPGRQMAQQLDVDLCRSTLSTPASSTSAWSGWAERGSTAITCGHVPAPASIKQRHFHGGLRGVQH